MFVSFSFNHTVLSVYWTKAFYSFINAGNDENGLDMCFFFVGGAVGNSDDDESNCDMLNIILEYTMVQMSSRLPFL